jgi:hypothetical protein
MDPVERKDDHYDEVGNQDRGIKPVPTIKAVEVIDLVRIVRLPIVTDALGSEQQPEESRRYMREKVQVDAPGTGAVWVDSTRYDAESRLSVYCVRC